MWRSLQLDKLNFDRVRRPMQQAVDEQPIALHRHSAARAIGQREVADFVDACASDIAEERLPSCYDNETRQVTQSWIFAPHLMLKVPRSAFAIEGFATAESRQRAALTYFPVMEAKQHGLDAAEASSIQPSKILGFVAWFLPGAASPVASPLVIRELGQHTGTRVWAAAWLHREWALAHSECFAGQPTVLEMGAGCGLLGLSVASNYDAHVMLSDFQGHVASSRTVLHNLLHNCEHNAPIVRAGGGTVQVLELDWAAPQAPREWSFRSEHQDDRTMQYSPGGCRLRGLNKEPDGRLFPPSSCQMFPGDVPRQRTPGAIAIEQTVVRPADIVLATEVLYTDSGTRYFVDALAMWLSRPHGTCYLVNNVRRTNVASFEALCMDYGLAVEQMSSLEGSGGADVASDFAPPWDDIDLFAFLKVTWQPA